MKCKGKKAKNGKDRKRNVQILLPNMPAKSKTALAQMTVSIKHFEEASFLLPSSLMITSFWRNQLFNSFQARSVNS